MPDRDRVELFEAVVRTVDLNTHLGDGLHHSPIMAMGPLVRNRTAAGDPRREVRKAIRAAVSNGYLVRITAEGRPYVTLATEPYLRAASEWAATREPPAKAALRRLNEALG